MKGGIYLTIVVFFFINYFFDGVAENKKKFTVPDVIKIPSTIGEVNLPHKNHFTDYGADCKSCHHEINASQLKIPHKDYFKDIWKGCYICHKSDKQQKLVYQCSNCHKSLSTNPADERQSSKVVLHISCSKCHDLGKDKKASANCKFCHSGPKKKLSLNY